MPTIPELPNAIQTGLQDEIPISQGGITRSVTVAELLSDAQPLIEVPSPSILGRASIGPGGFEALAVGVGLSIQAAAVVANGADHSGFLQESNFSVGDEVVVNSAGTPKRLPVTSLRNLFSGGRNVTIDTAGVVSASTDAIVSTSLTNLTQGVSAAQASIALLGSKIPAGGFATLNSNGQLTAPVAGDVGAGRISTSSSAPYRTLAARSVDVLNVLDFGAVVGGADCAGAINAAFTNLPATGGEIWLPPGDYWLLSSVLMAGKAVVLRGSGRGQTRVHLQHSGVGFDISPGSLFNKSIVVGLTLLAESNSGQTSAGIRVTYPAVSAFGYVTTVVHEVEFFGYPNGANATSPFPQTFLRGLVLNNCWSSQITNVSWFGPPAVAGTTSSAVIEVNGSIDTRLHSVQAYYGNTVILQSGYCEGIYVSSPLVVGTDYLMLQTDETKWAGYAIGRAMLLGLWVSNGEVNTNVGTVKLANVTDGFFANLDVTRDGGPNTGQVLFDFLNVSNFHVSGCNFVGGPSGGSGQDVAFQFRSTYNSSSNIVGSCHFENLTTVIKVIGANGTVGLTTYGLHLGNVPLATAIIDQTSQDVGNYISFITPSQPGVPAGHGNSKDHVFGGATGATLFRVNNVMGAVNYIRHQPAVPSAPPTICFDGADAVVNGVIQTKGGNLSINAAGGSTGSGNLVSFQNTPNAANWVTLQNAAVGNLSLLGTNSGGLSVQPKGALWIAPSGGLYMPGLPTSKPTTGTGQIWNNNGIVSIA